MDFKNYTIEQLYAQRDYLIMSSSEESKNSEQYKSRLNDLNNLIFERNDTKTNYP